jgi:hypothetical protein
MGPLGDQPQPVEVSGAARQEGHQSSVAALGARAPPILAAFLRQSFEEITDEVMDLYDRCLAQSHARASRDLDEFRLAIAKATNEKVLLFRDIGHRASRARPLRPRWRVEANYLPVCARR